MSEPRRRPTRTAARSALQGGIRTTLGLAFENRLIVVAQGIQFHNTQLPARWRIPECLLDEAANPRDDLKIPHLVRISANEVEYTNNAQRVRYKIWTTTSKQDFHDYMEGRGARSLLFGNNVMVVYGGHARYGRGPCLGTTDAPGDHWGTGADPSTEGIFRMGYPYMEVPVLEILHHQYRATIARQQSSAPEIAAVDLRSLPRELNIHPHLRPHLGATARTKGYSLAELNTMLQEFLDDVADAAARNPHTRGLALNDLRGNLEEALEAAGAGRTSLGPYIYGSHGAADRFWATYCYERIGGHFWNGTRWVAVQLQSRRTSTGRFKQPHMILRADWQNTVSGTWRPTAAGAQARMDLGATWLANRSFCHFGCSTFVHNFPVMRGRGMKNYQQSADRNDRHCYWTTESAYGDIVPYWLYHTLTYVPGQPSRFRTREWGDTLRYARDMTNRDLSLDRRRYQLR